ncbi:MAG TPA: 3-phosphoshikimate 1-carboxyvinyltransferase [Candidatus Acidoferrum sp.]|nr:3-phosphoshikimate 1-carboxyvinyltransferase [Candidatus Acidoferrum sp.]
MPLPGLIEIVPLQKAVRAEITVPGSKSITNRALVLAALADGETVLRGALWSEDTQVMVECLQELGFMINITPDPGEVCNRTITVYGKGGLVPRGGTAGQPLELFVGNAGTAARFLAALVCLGQGVYRLHGTPRMHERPQAALFAALRELGYDVESEAGNEKLPARMSSAEPSSGVQPRVTGASGQPARFPRSCSVSIEQSSQFASALLLCAEAGNWRVEVLGENAEESPYVRMTAELIKVFPKRGGGFVIEPDASSGSYFLAAGELVPGVESVEWSDKFGINVPTVRLDCVRVAHWPRSGWQVDERFREVLACRIWPTLHFGIQDASQPSMTSAIGDEVISRAHDLGDSIMTAIVLAPFSAAPVRFTDLGRLRLQECERVEALRTELTRCGAKVVEEGDTLTVYPSNLHGADVETYNDHRMAMCFAILGLKVPGIKVKNPSCVKKTFPSFFQKLAAQPPGGLGTVVLDGRTGRALNQAELFAE